MRKTRSTTKHLLGISPANRWPFRKQEPVGRIIPEASYLRTTRRLGSMAAHSDSYSQPLLERDHEGSPERSITRILTAPRFSLPSINE